MPAPSTIASVRAILANSPRSLLYGMPLGPRAMTCAHAARAGDNIQCRFLRGSPPRWRGSAGKARGRSRCRSFSASRVPQLAAYVKPYLGETVFVLLVFSYLRIDPPPSAPVPLAAPCHRSPRCWVMMAVPLLFGAAYTAAGLRAGPAGLYTIMILQIAITPITSSAAFAALMGLDVAFSLAALIASQRAVAAHDGCLQLPVSRHVAVLADRSRHQAVPPVCRRGPCRLCHPAPRRARLDRAAEGATSTAST